VIVVDASILATALADDGLDGRHARARIAEQTLAAPALIDLEVVSVLRRSLSAERITPRRAGQAIEDLLRLPLQRAPHTPLLPRIWQLRDNLTPYDAAYVALAEAALVPLLTADQRLARAPGIRCEVTLLESRQN
jgi:predicted nucleic acid-binding protein